MSNREPNQTFESCPAATGEPSIGGRAPCTGFPDGAHRCARPRQHDDANTGPAYVHWCTDGFRWTSKVYEAARV